MENFRYQLKDFELQALADFRGGPAVLMGRRVRSAAEAEPR